jgi:hypothetical protein
MRAHELVLVESGGIFKRDPSDPPFTALAGNSFGAKPGDEYQFVNVEAFPKSGAFPDEKRRDAAIAAALKGATAIKANTPTKRSLAFGLATLQDASGKPVKFLKYFAAITGSMLTKWKNKELPGLQSELQGSQKRRAGLTPADILKGRTEFKNGKDLMNYVMGVQSLSPDIKAGLAMIGKGSYPVFANSGENLAAIRDNLGEIIQALCLTHGLVKGDADLARVNVFDPATNWSTLAITFPLSETQNLVDFALKEAGKELAVSSKGGKGAAASTKSIIKFYDGLQPQDKTAFNGNFPEVVDLIENLKTYSSKEAPLRMANLKQKQISEVLNLINNSVTDIKKLSPWAKEQLGGYAAQTPVGWNYGFWILAKIAKDVTAQFNKNSANSKGLRELLSKASLLQCRTLASTDNNNNVVIGSITPKFPPAVGGRVVLTSDKSYRANAAEGHVTFRIS